MAARILRYKWLIELLKSEEAKYIAVAHHQGDAIETFFINLVIRKFNSDSCALVLNLTHSVTPYASAK